ncbi:hypothetical protein ANN_16269 [Periplaneta americana]|uniref:BRCT domain-containing protein n=1 Tax=Periplaneta americana TaxID=6978 RepID=A0ABQ8SKF6_PERAM|nr:hypothetical protein ANN_16269 [Periplaneta americana]
MYLREVGYDGRDWINLVQDRDQWRAYNATLRMLRVKNLGSYCGIRLERSAGIWLPRESRARPAEGRAQEGEARALVGTGAQCEAKAMRPEVLGSKCSELYLKVLGSTYKNVLEGKRSRLSGKETPKALDTPGISGESKSTPKRKVSSPVSSESDAGSALDYVDGVEAESTGFEFKSGRVKGQSKSTPRKNDITLLLGPMPPQGSKIFAGKFFLLTISDATGHELEATDNSSTENTDTAESDKNPLALLRTDIPFSKSYLAEQISAGGGTVCNRFQEIAPNKYDVCYLITNKPNLTSKFIFCLAHGIPILSHSWIVDSCKKNSCLDTLEYVVPGGWSLEKKQYINKQKQRPLSRMKVGLVSEQKYFVKFWEIVLKGAGASVFLIPAEKVFDSYD